LEIKAGAKAEGVVPEEPAAEDEGPHATANGWFV
jgi:hypothetical protein